MNYSEVLDSIEIKIEQLLEDFVNDNVYKSPKTEDRLTALCLSREYLKEKIRHEHLQKFYEENGKLIVEDLKDTQEVENEG